MEKRKIFSIILAVIAVLCIGYFIYYYIRANQSQNDFSGLSEMKQTDPEQITVYQTVPKPEKEEEGEEAPPEVLDEYKTLLIRNKNLIGWLKIDDTNIDYPVMKSVNGDGTYYLDHNFDQKEDKNGTLFMDDSCDPVSPCDNMIIYGHNMKSGKMFGSLDAYKSESFYKKHKNVQFDTIYRKGVYQVMFAFQSRVYSEAEITFKYYQFINPNSELEFDSGIEEMKKMSIYDTGITAEYGDELITLSTCDYDEPEGRFVVVCKRVK